MKNTKRILAIAGIVLLLAMYITALVSALISSPMAHTLFLASFACTILVPVILYAFLLVAKVISPAKSPLIDNIVFDVGNVLVDFDWRGHLERLEFDEETCEFLTKEVLQNPLWNEFDRGAEPFYDIVDQFCQTYPDHEADIRKFFEDPDDLVRELSFAVPWIRSLHQKGYKLYVLSNWDQPMYDSLKDTMLRFEKDMDGAIWSYQHQLVKPEPEIFQRLIDLYKLDPHRSVFLDDKQENLDAAAEFGFSTILVKDHQAALDGLATLGIK